MLFSRLAVFAIQSLDGSLKMNRFCIISDSLVIFFFVFCWHLMAWFFTCFLRLDGSVYRFVQPGNWQPYGFWNNKNQNKPKWEKSVLNCDMLRVQISILTASKCVRWCFARSELLLNTFMHPSYWQPYGRSPVCDRWCIFKFSSREKDLSQPSNCTNRQKTNIKINTFNHRIFSLDHNKNCRWQLFKRK